MESVIGEKRWCGRIGKKSDLKPGYVGQQKVWTGKLLHTINETTTSQNFV